MTDHESEPTQKRRLSIWKRLSLLVGALVLALTALTVVEHYWQGANAKFRLARLMSELDESDPGWRLEEIEAVRIAPPNEENSALIVRSARDSQEHDRLQGNGAPRHSASPHGAA